MLTLAGGAVRCGDPPPGPGVLLALLPARRREPPLARAEPAQRSCPYAAKGAVGFPPVLVEALLYFRIKPGYKSGESVKGNPSSQGHSCQ